MRSAGLDALIADGAIISTEAQAHLADLHDGCPWSVDLEAGTFTFGDPHPGTYPVQLVGTAAAGPQTWRWGWAQEIEIPDGVLAAVGEVRALGEQYRIPELTAPEWPFPAGESLEDPALRLGLDLTTATVAASGTWFGYSGEIGGRTRVWMLLGGITLPVPTVLRTTRSIGESLQVYELSDHRRAVTSYAALRRIPFDGARLTLADGQLQVEFDDAGRIIGMKGVAGPG